MDGQYVKPNPKQQQHKQTNQPQQIKKSKPKMQLFVVMSEISTKIKLEL